MKQLSSNSLTDAASILSEAFYQDPRFVYILKTFLSEEIREFLYKFWFPHVIKYMLEHGGSVWGVSVNGILAGVALWVPPNKNARVPPLELLKLIIKSKFPLAALKNLVSLLNVLHDNYSSSMKAHKAHWGNIQTIFFFNLLNRICFF